MHVDAFGVLHPIQQYLSYLVQIEMVMGRK